VSHQLVTTSRFERRLRKFARDHPDLKSRLARVLGDLETDPFQPRLRLHPVRGELQGPHAVSVTYSYRLTLTLRIDAREIALLDIGSHDDVY
jgi:mRNA-degrading endonuclease YafQ of YafQ-DinJ toxin-antitoxin module